MTQHLEEKIEALKQAIAQQQGLATDFESALSDVQSPPKYPNPNPSDPFLRLQQMIQDQESEEKRLQLLGAATQALTEAKAELAALQAQLRQA